MNSVTCVILYRNNIFFKATEERKKKPKNVVFDWYLFVSLMSTFNHSTAKDFSNMKRETVGKPNACG